MMPKRNGKIELLRFIFCMFVLLYHVGCDVIGGTRAVSAHLSFFAEGRISVEFFFLVSGYLAAKSAYKQGRGTSSIGSETFNFCAKKIKAILPYHIVAVMGSTILLAFYSDNFWHDFIVRLPSAFFLQRTGINGQAFVSVEWYICSMLLALAIVYPLLRKSFDMTTLVLAPVVSSLLIGYMTKAYGGCPRPSGSGPLPTSAISGAWP